MSSDALRGRLGLSAGEPLMAETLERALNRVFAMGLYQGVDYSLVQEGDTNGLLVEVTEKPWGPGLMYFGMAFGNDLERGRSSFTILATHRQTQLNGRGGELLFEVRLGEAQGAQVELFQPIDVGGRFFIAPRLDYQEESLEVAVLGAGEVSRGVRELHAAIALGAQWQDWGEFRVELVGGRVEERDADETPESDLSADVGAVLARFSVDLLDDASFPTSGSWGRVEAYRSAEALGADPTYTRLEVAALTALSKGRNTMVLRDDSARLSALTYLCTTILPWVGSNSCPGCDHASSWETVTLWLEPLFDGTWPRSIRRRPAATYTSGSHSRPATPGRNQTRGDSTS